MRAALFSWIAMACAAPVMGDRDGGELDARIAIDASRRDAGRPIDAGRDARSDASAIDAALECPPGAVTFPPASPRPFNQMYASWTVRPCIDSGDACRGSCGDDVAAMARCEPIQIGRWQPMGSLVFRVRAVDGDACVIDVGREVEGGVAHTRCRVPIDQPLCCSGQPLVMSDCQSVGFCNLLGGPDACPLDGTGPPFCPGGSLTCTP